MTNHCQPDKTSLSTPIPPKKLTSTHFSLLSTIPIFLALGNETYEYNSRPGPKETFQARQVKGGFYVRVDMPDARPDGLKLNSYQKVSKLLTDSSFNDVGIQAMRSETPASLRYAKWHDGLVCVPHGFKRNPNLSHSEDNLQSNFVESGWPTLLCIRMCFNDDTKPRGLGIKVAVIDGSNCFVSFNQSSDYSNGFIRKPICNTFCEKCAKDTIVNRRGLYCGLIIVGKIHNTNWGIRGVAPSFEIYFHTVSCPSCWNDAYTVNKTIHICISNKINVISMSLAPEITDEMHVSFIKRTLHPFRRGIVMCASVGNDGPSRRTTLYGMPWLVIVGACTSCKILTTYFYVAKTEEEKISIVAEFEVPYNELPQNRFFSVVMDEYLSAYWEGHMCYLL